MKDFNRQQFDKIQQIVEAKGEMTPEISQWFQDLFDNRGAIHFNTDGTPAEIICPYHQTDNFDAINYDDNHFCFVDRTLLDKQALCLKAPVNRNKFWQLYTDVIYPKVAGVLRLMVEDHSDRRFLNFMERLFPFKTDAHGNNVVHAFCAERNLPPEVEAQMFYLGRTVGEVAKNLKAGLGETTTTTEIRTDAQMGLAGRETVESTQTVDGIAQHFKQLNFSKIYANKDGSRSSSMLNRVIVPVRNLRGDIVMLVGRDLINDPDYPKYMYSLAGQPVPGGGGMEAPYTQATLVYGAEYLPYHHRVYVTEGLFDADALRGQGVMGISTFTCHLSPAQQYYLDNKEVVFCYDNDQPGRDGAYQGAYALLNHQVLPEFLFPPADRGKDWNEVLKHQPNKPYPVAERLIMKPDDTVARTTTYVFNQDQAVPEFEQKFGHPVDFLTYTTAHFHEPEVYRTIGIRDPHELTEAQKFEVVAGLGFRSLVGNGATSFERSSTRKKVETIIAWMMTKPFGFDCGIGDYYAPDPAQRAENRKKFRALYDHFLAQNLTAITNQLTTRDTILLAVGMIGRAIQQQRTNGFYTRDTAAKLEKILHDHDLAYADATNIYQELGDALALDDVNVYQVQKLYSRRIRRPENVTQGDYNATQDTIQKLEHRVLRK